MKQPELRARLDPLLIKHVALAGLYNHDENTIGASHLEAAASGIQLAHSTTLGQHLAPRSRQASSHALKRIVVWQRRWRIRALQPRTLHEVPVQPACTPMRGQLVAAEKRRRAGAPVSALRQAKDAAMVFTST